MRVTDERRFMQLRGNVPQLRGRRAAVYAASLIQAESLLKTARTTAIQARPILLYYGILQAGNAVMAVKNEQAWQPRGHGLTYEPPLTSGLVGDVVVKLDSDATRGGFQYMCDALGVGAPQYGASASIADLWSALPGGKTPLLSSTPALPAIPSDEYRSYVWEQDEMVVQFNLPPEVVGQYTSYEDFKRAYPSTKHEGASLGSFTDDGTPILRALQAEAWNIPEKVVVAAESATRIGPNNPLPNIPQDDQRFLVPTAGTFGTLPEILNWWLLHYGLSMCARYTSDLWGNALRVDGSPDYLHLKDFLDSSRLVPLVLHALETL